MLYNRIEEQKRLQENASRAFQAHVELLLKKHEEHISTGPTNCSDDAFSVCFFFFLFHIRSSIHSAASTMWAQRKKKNSNLWQINFIWATWKSATLKWDGRKCATLKSLKMNENENEKKKQPNDMKWNEWNEWKQNKWSRPSIEHPYIRTYWIQAWIICDTIWKAKRWRQRHIEKLATKCWQKTRTSTRKIERFLYFPYDKGHRTMKIECIYLPNSSGNSIHWYCAQKHHQLKQQR